MPRTCARRLTAAFRAQVRCLARQPLVEASASLGEDAGSWCAESLAVDVYVGLPNGLSSLLLADAASAAVRSARAHTPLLDGRLLDDNLPTRRSMYSSQQKSEWCKHLTARPGFEPRAC